MVVRPGPRKGVEPAAEPQKGWLGHPERPGSLVGLFHHILGLPPALMGGVGEGRAYPALEHRDGRWNRARRLGTGRRCSMSWRRRGPPREGGRHPCCVFVLGQASTRPCAERCPCTVHHKPLDRPGGRRWLAASSHPLARPGRLGHLDLQAGCLATECELSETPHGLLAGKGDAVGGPMGLGRWPRVGQAEECGEARQRDGKDQVRGGEETRWPGRGSPGAEPPRIRTWTLKPWGRQGVPGWPGASSLDRHRVRVSRRHKAQRKKLCDEDHC